jgi:hypothetical protein
MEPAHLLLGIDSEYHQVLKRRAALVGVREDQAVVVPQAVPDPFGAAGRGTPSECLDARPTRRARGRRRLRPKSGVTGDRQLLGARQQLTEADTEQERGGCAEGQPGMREPA